MGFHGSAADSLAALFYSFVNPSHSMIPEVPPPDHGVYRVGMLHVPTLFHRGKKATVHTVSLELRFGLGFVTFSQQLADSHPGGNITPH